MRSRPPDAESPRPAVGRKLVLRAPRGYRRRPPRWPSTSAPASRSVASGPTGSCRSIPLSPTASFSPSAALPISSMSTIWASPGLPVGISEVGIVPAAPMPVRDDAMPVVLGCDAGMSLSVSGQVVPLRAETTVGALRAGALVTAVPCGPIHLASGEQELTVNPSGAFSVNRVQVRTDRWSSAPASEASQRVSRPTTLRWDATHREAKVDAAPSTRVLVIPESTNPGWKARLDGTDLQPLTVNGWQQGWIIPAGTSGTVALTYPLDGPYRWSLGLGLAVLAVVLALAFGGARWSRYESSPSGLDPLDHRNSPTVLGAVAFLGASWLLAGWWGLALSTVVGAGMWRWTTRKDQRPLRRRPVVAAFTLFFFAATCGLAAGPWKSPTGYNGFDWWVQALALAAVAVTMWRSILHRNLST